jgi:magnesium transporter
MCLAVAVLGSLRSGTFIGLIVAVSMLIIVMIGSVIGAGLPFVLSRLKVDPATASGPLITTLSDISGVILYFSIATVLIDRFG